MRVSQCPTSDPPLRGATVSERILISYQRRRTRGFCQLGLWATIPLTRTAVKVLAEENSPGNVRFCSGSSSRISSYRMGFRLRARILQNLFPEHELNGSTALIGIIIDFGHVPTTTVRTQSPAHERSVQSLNAVRRGVAEAMNGWNWWLCVVLGASTTKFTILCHLN